MKKHILLSVEYLQNDLRAAYKKLCLHKKTTYPSYVVEPADDVEIKQVLQTNSPDCSSFPGTKRHTPVFGTRSFCPCYQGNIFPVWTQTWEFGSFKSFAFQKKLWSCYKVGPKNRLQMELWGPYKWP